ncbi:uncharacterized, partial [Tachysurus ichikawai]
MTECITYLSTVIHPSAPDSAKDRRRDEEEEWNRGQDWLRNRSGLQGCHD